LELPLSDLLNLEADDSPEFRRGCRGVFKDLVGVVSGIGWMASLAGLDWGITSFNWDSFSSLERFRSAVAVRTSIFGMKVAVGAAGAGGEVVV
jgi:hypothetical protein